MKYIEHSHRYAKEIFLSDSRMSDEWREVESTISGITDEDLINQFNFEKGVNKSISKTINHILKERLVKIGWNAESPIFADPNYCDNSQEKGRWRLDFAKGDVAIEVAFNHGGNVAWNLIKPVLSSELNHVEKAIQTKAGILITATDSLKKTGGFDNAVGTYEKYVEYLKPLNNLLTTPLLIIGLESPETFKIIQKKNSNNQTIGYVELLENGVIIE